MLAFVWGGITAMLSARDLWTAVWTTCNVFPVFLLLPGALHGELQTPRWQQMGYVPGSHLHRGSSCTQCIPCPWPVPLGTPG